MIRNVGDVDRVIRVVLGLALIAFAIPLGLPRTGWNCVGWIGVIPLATGLLGSCPAYGLFGITTRGRRRQA